MNDQNDEIEIDLWELLDLLLHKLWIIIPTAMVTFVIGFCIAMFAVTPMYESTTGIYVMSRQNSDTLSISDTQLSSQLTKDYEQLIQSRTVLEAVIAQTGIDESYGGLKSRVAISNVKDTRIIYITVTDANPEMARVLADAIREEGAQHIQAVTNVEAVNVVDEANLPTSPSSPSVAKWALIGGFIGAFASMAVIIIRFLMDDTIKSSEDVEKYLGWSTLALIPMMYSEGQQGKGKDSGKKKKNSSKNGLKAVSGK